MKKKLLILVCFLIVLSGIGIVNAETLTGDIGGDGDYNSTLYDLGVSNTQARDVLMYIYTDSIEYTAYIKTIVQWDGTSPSTFRTNAPHGIQSNVTYYAGDINGRILGTGTAGYQRLFAQNGSEIAGYQYWSFNDDWNVSGLSGGQQIYVKNSSDLYDAKYSQQGALTNFPTGQGYFYGSQAHATIPGNPTAGAYNILKQPILHNEYSVSKPSGIGIEGYVSKVFNGKPYTSRVYITNGSTSQILTNQNTVTTTPFNFSTNVQSIKICILDTQLMWWNSSELFGGTGPGGTPTPTVTPTTAPTIAPGYVRTNVWVMDHLGNGVHGVDIAMYDIEGTTWSNSTGDADARHYIDTLPYHTLNLYADLTAFPDEFLPASLLGVETGYSGESYYLVMYPTTLPPGDGNVNLYVTVTDEDTGFLIRDAALTATYGTTTQGGTSGSTGTEIFVVPNQTNIRITGSKAGYTSATQYLNSGTGTVINTGLELTKLLVTTVPTGTIPPGGLTIPPTVNPHDPSITGNTNAAAQDMMNYLAANGMQLVQLCFLVTILGLLGIKLGK